MSSTAAPAVTHHKAALNEVTLHYRRAGRGEPLVLLHGFPQTGYTWRKVLPWLIDRYDVVMPDLRGCGDSDKPSTGYDKRTVAEDVRQLVDHLGLGPISLAAHDVGMMVAYEFAAANRDLVARLVLMEATVPGLGREQYWDVRTYPRFWFLPLFYAPDQVAEALIGGREHLFVRQFMLPQTYDPSAIDDAAVDVYATTIAAPGALHAGIEYFRTYVADAPRNRDHARDPLPMPVLTLAGATSLGERLQAEIEPLGRDVRGVVLDRCGHFLPEERPDEVARLMIDFLSG